MVPDGSVPVQLGRLRKKPAFPFLALARVEREIASRRKVAVTFHRLSLTLDQTVAGACG
jgi:hypothetical protein